MQGCRCFTLFVHTLEAWLCICVCFYGEQDHPCDSVSHQPTFLCRSRSEPPSWTDCRRDSVMIDAEQIRNIDGVSRALQYQDTVATPFLPAQRCLHSTPVAGNVRGRSLKPSHNKRSRPARRCFHAHVPGAARACPSRKAKGVRGRLVAAVLTPGAPAPSSGVVSPATTGDGGAWVQTQYSLSCHSSGHCAVNCARGLS